MFPLPIPQPPDWRIDWTSIDPHWWMQELKGCPQHPERHAEGDVWIHVHMVCEAMVALEQWRALPENERRLLFMGALFHDVAKPICTRIEADGRITSRGHSWRGAVRTRSILWRMGVPFTERETICAIVRHHLVPFFLVDSEQPQRLAAEVSQTIRCDWLSIMAEADAKGRICPDPQKLLDQIALFREQATEAGCLTQPLAFPTDHARFLYFRDAKRQPDSVAYEDFRCEVILMSGLPGAGKDHWIAESFAGWPVVSLDVIRDELGIPPSDPQGQVLQTARERAKDHLRNKRHFIWNATNLSRNIRNECIRLFHDYNARIRIVYVEVPNEQLYHQNQTRKRKVPDKVIERLLERWETPDCTEAHRVEYIVT